MLEPSAQPNVTFSPKKRAVKHVSIRLIILVAFVIMGIAAQFFAGQSAWQKWPPVVVLAALAVCAAAFACFVSAAVSENGRLTRALWIILGASLALDGLYEWLSMRQIVGDEDAFVVFFCLISACSAYALWHLEALSTDARNAWAFVIAVQGLATVTDASDGGLSLAGGAPLESLGYIADFLDLIWTPACALTMAGIAIELLRRRNRIYPNDSERVIWILSAGRLGDLTQMRVLAEALGWRTEVKTIALKSQLRLGIPALAPFLFDRSKSALLRRPWPDLVITAEAPLSPLAKWIRDRSAGNSRTVHIGRPAGTAAGHDLVLSTPQFSLPDPINMLTLPVPLAFRPDDRTTLSDPDVGSRFETLPRPILGVLVGGASTPYAFPEEEVRYLVRRCEEFASGTGGTVYILTSPRTGSSLEEVITRAAGDTTQVYLWGRDRGLPNPYCALLKVADRFVVTSDSISMISEALATDKPVHVHDLPIRPYLMPTVAAALAKLQTEDASLRFINPLWWLFRLGLIYVPADKPELIRTLRRDGAICDLPGSRGEGFSSLATIAESAVRRLFADHV